MSLSSAMLGAVSNRSRRQLVFTVVQFTSLMPLALVTGAVFGIWRGYDPASWQVTTFLEVHQGAVRGLNTLLPVLGGVSLAGMALLAISARRHRGLFLRYLAALVCIASAALITRFGNQPINAEIMTWTADAIPVHWEALRDRWWDWHVMRFAATVGGLLILVAAIFHDRGLG
jgi:hypothetical protein